MAHQHSHLRHRRHHHQQLQRKRNDSDDLATPTDDTWGDSVAAKEVRDDDDDDHNDDDKSSNDGGPSTVYHTVYTTIGKGDAYTTLDADKTSTESIATTTSNSPSSEKTTSAKETSSSSSKSTEGTTTIKETSTSTKASSSTMASSSTDMSTSQSTSSASASSTSIFASESGLSSLPASYVPTSEAIPTELAVATSSQSLSSLSSATSILAPSSATSAAAVQTSSTDSGSSSSISAGAKAGIAIGALGGVLLVFAAVFFAFSRRKKQAEEQRMRHSDEKFGNPFEDGADVPPPTPAKAPRLSLRPVTQFLPNLTGQFDRRASRGDAIAMVTSPTQQTDRTGGGDSLARPETSASANSANPFGHAAERIHSPIPEESRPSSPSSLANSHVGIATSTDAPSEMSNADVQNTTAAAAATSPAAEVGAVTAAGAVTTLVRKASLRKDNPPMPLNLTKTPGALSPVPPSPSGTEFSMQSAAQAEQTPGPSAGAAVVATAGAAPQSAVHRVQLDFSPTLDDELELKAGQLVRLLHEYDDGWALCIRLDRSQEGVAPRTCLSTRPVKPRPAPGAPRYAPPVNPNRGPGFPPGQRGIAPQGGPARPYGGPPYPGPESPSSRTPMAPVPGSRPYSPAGRPMNPYGAPSSPATGRPMSPGPRPQSSGPRYQQGRPQSPGLRVMSPGPQQAQGQPQSPPAMSQRASPLGPSPMGQGYQPSPPDGPIGRKPVPGQAL